MPITVLQGSGASGPGGGVSPGLDIHTGTVRVEAFDFQSLLGSTLTIDLPHGETSNFYRFGFWNDDGTLNATAAEYAGGVYASSLLEAVASVPTGATTLFVLTADLDLSGAGTFRIRMSGTGGGGPFAYDSGTLPL